MGKVGIRMSSRLYAMTVTQLAEGDFLFECPIPGIFITGSESTLVTAIKAGKDALFFTLSEYSHEDLLPSITSTQLEKLKEQSMKSTYYQLIHLTSADIETIEKELSY